MSYTFKVVPELVWAVLLAVLGYLYEALSGAKIGDFTTWAAWVPILVGCGRAALGAALAFLTPSGSFQKT